MLLHDLKNGSISPKNTDQCIDLFVCNIRGLSKEMRG